MKTKSAITAAACALALVAVPSAFAQTYCVNDTACLFAGGSAEPTLQDALAASDATAELDHVMLGAGTYTAPTTTGFAAFKPVDIVGQGPGDTVLTGPADAGRVLYLGGSGSHIANLEVSIPQELTSPTKEGLYAIGTLAENLEITEPNAPSTVTIGATLYSGSTLQDSDVYLPSSGATTVGVDLEQSATAQRDHILSRYGIDYHGQDTHAIRDDIYANSEGLSVVNSATNMDLTDSVLWMTGSSTAVGISTGNGTDAGIAIRGCTIIGDGTSGARGVAVSSSQNYAASASVDSSIIRGFTYPLVRIATAGSADVAIQYSDFDPGKVSSGVGAGAIAQGAGNVNVDPLFVNNADLHLSPSSPLADAGNPADLGDTTDLDGNARVADFNGDGIARRDIGAYELPGKPVPATGGDPSPTAPGDAPAPAGSTDPIVAGPSADRTAPVVSHIHRKGQRLAFRLSEDANVVLRIGTRSVKREYARGSDSLALARLVRKPGTYRLKLVAIDAAGNRSRTHSLRLVVR